MKFPCTVADIEELIDLLKSLETEDKLYLVCQTLQCAEDDTDNNGQIILHTNLKCGEDGEVREMIPDDLEEEDDELDL